MPVPASTAPIARQSAKAAVLEQLRIWIENGVLEPNEPLKDSEIAERLGVSRTPVREALQTLEQLGVVEMLPGRVTRVTPLSSDDVAQLYAPLGALHASAAELGTSKATAEDVAEMRRHNTALLDALKASDQVAARDADRDFHHVLIRLAGNPYLQTAIEPLLIQARRLEALYFREVGPALASYDEHERIIVAVEAGDGREAARLTRSNLDRFWHPPASGS